MAKRILILLAALFLCSCSIELDAQSLLKPPLLTQQQSAVYDALEAAIGTSSFKFKYPRSGSNLSAVTLRDLDGDGLEEAIAFYELESGTESSIWISILAQQNGTWRSIRQIPGEQGEIDRLEFVSILDNTESILVGWGSAASEKNTCMFYFYEDGQVEKYKTNFSYRDLTIDDIDGDGHEEILLCNYSEGSAGSLVLLHESGGRIVRTATVDLPSQIASVQQICAGDLTAGLPAVFVDALLYDGSVETYIALIENTATRTVLRSLSESELGIYDGSNRPAGQGLCADVNGDGLIDIPVCKPLAGYEEDDEDVVWLTTYQSVIDSELRTVARFVTDSEEGYRFRFPAAWDDAVTVQRYPVNREWRFVLYNDSNNGEATELLRIRAVSPSDYQDKFETSQYVTVATKGIYEYQISVPTEQVARYGISLETATAAFSLL